MYHILTVTHTHTHTHTVTHTHTHARARTGRTLTLTETKESHTRAQKYTYFLFLPHRSHSSRETRTAQNESISGIVRSTDPSAINNSRAVKLPSSAVSRHQCVNVCAFSVARSLSE